MAPRALMSLLSKRRTASSSEIRWPAITFSWMSRSPPCWRRKFIEPDAVGASSHHSEIWKHHFRDGYRQKDRADDCIEFEEGGVDPFQTAFPRQPVFQH